ncbi:hypothetical protein EMA8858_01211 [Emticicia aquatica]|uniref:Uncharacterized protein n=1 Tax=Emticicia aquatica TaxID=1681835 RepID=A0ABM9AP93_9BACT|nr:hypothetical protein [Emticicia aquatica]CAH0995091.1 hypothetical protein EMA8858_01211 [Emticicia aquatica]
MFVRNGTVTEFKDNDFEIIVVNYTSSKRNMLIIAAAVDLFGNDTLNNLRQVMLLLYIILVFAVGVTVGFLQVELYSPFLM